MQVDWTRDPVPTPPATFTVTLTEEEAETLRRYCFVSDGYTFRRNNGLIYDLDDKICEALLAAEGQ